MLMSPCWVNMFGSLFTIHKSCGFNYYHLYIFMNPTPSRRIIILKTNNFGLLFLICCWLVWKSRNKESLTNNSYSLWNILNQIYTCFHPTKKIFGDSNKDLNPRLVSWHHSLKNVIKVNIDGNSIGKLDDPVLVVF